MKSPFSYGFPMVFQWFPNGFWMISARNSGRRSPGLPLEPPGGLASPNRRRPRQRAQLAPGGGRGVLSVSVYPVTPRRECNAPVLLWKITMFNGEMGTDCHDG